jgi:hypothetical protein
MRMMPVGAIPTITVTPGGAARLSLETPPHYQYNISRAAFVKD